MKMIIGDRFADSSSGEVIEVTNPYDGTLVDTVPAASKDDIDRAVAEAVSAQKEWRKTPVYRRVELARRFLELVEENKEDLARKLSLESGKNITAVSYTHLTLPTKA